MTLPAAIRDVVRQTSAAVEPTPAPRGPISLVELLICAFVFLVLWASLSPLLGAVYSPDSYAYYLLGHGLSQKFQYATEAVRDYGGPHVFPQPSRSFPPLWPLLVGTIDRITGARVGSTVYANALVLGLSVAAFRWLSRELDPRSGWLIFTAYPLFFVLDDQFREELAAGRAIPLTAALHFLLGAAVVRSLNAHRLELRHGVAIGVLAAALPLTRFDQLPFALSAAAAAPWFWARQHGRASALKPALCLLAAAALAYLPWGLRNLLVFGSWFASDNAASVLSTAPGIPGISFFSPHHLPDTLWTNPRTWFEQRLAYATENMFIVYGLLLPVIVPCAFLLGLAWKRLDRRDLAIVALGGLHLIGTFVAVSLTSLHERRYFSIILADAAVLLALSLRRMLPSDRAAKLAGALVGGLILCSPAIGAVRALRAAPRPLAALRPRAPQARDHFQSAALLLAQVVRPGSLVASWGAENLSYYTGYRTIYLPLNARESQEDFRAWLAAWNPDFILAQPSWVQTMGLDGWRMPDLDVDGDVLLQVPPASKP